MSQEIQKLEQTKVTDEELIMHLQNLGLLKDLNEGEKNSYIQIAKAFNLNLFKREIHVSKYGGQMAIITGYEVYIKRAERTGQLDGWSVTTEGTVKDNTLKAIVTIHRKDRKHPFVWEALYSEYVQMKDGQPNKFWRKATTMIKKVAISQAFRLCFSDELGGMPYTSDEIQTEEAQFEEVKTQTTAPVQPTTITKPAPAQQQPATGFISPAEDDTEFIPKWQAEIDKCTKKHELMHLYNNNKAKVDADERLREMFKKQQDLIAAKTPAA